MTQTNTKRRTSLLSLALASLIMTSLSTGSAEASWSWPRCKAQCMQRSCSKDTKRLNDCAINCDNSSIKSCVIPNCSKLNVANQSKLQALLKSKQSDKEEEHSIVEKQLKNELSNPNRKPRNSKIKTLSQKQEKLINEINILGQQIQQCAPQSTDKMAAVQPTEPESDVKLPEPSSSSKWITPHRSNQAASDPKIGTRRTAQSQGSNPPPPPPLPTEKTTVGGSSFENQPKQGRASLRKSGSPYATSPENPAKQDLPPPPPPPLNHLPPPPKGQPSAVMGDTTVSQGQPQDLLADIRKGKELKKSAPTASQQKEDSPQSTSPQSIGEILKRKFANAHPSEDPASEDPDETENEWR